MGQSLFCGEFYLVIILNRFYSKVIQSIREMCRPDPKHNLGGNIFVESS